MRSAGCNSIARPVFGMTEIIPIAPILSSYLWDTTLADYLVGTRKAHYYFTVKGNQPGLLEALEFYFRDRGQPHFVEHTPPDHGRIETRKIWTTTELNSYLDFPHVGQAFVIERHRTDKKSGESSLEISYGLTSRPRKEASPQRVLKVNRGHWVIGVSRERHINQSVKVRPRPGDSRLVAPEAA